MPDNAHQLLGRRGNFKKGVSGKEAAETASSRGCFMPGYGFEAPRFLMMMLI
jgi:hypothetical protein